MTGAKDTITFIFAVDVDNNKTHLRRTIHADSSCEAFQKVINDISETEVNVTSIRLISRSDRTD